MFPALGGDAFQHLLSCFLRGQPYTPIHDLRGPVSPTNYTRVKHIQMSRSGTGDNLGDRSQNGSGRQLITGPDRSLRRRVENLPRTTLVLLFFVVFLLGGSLSLVFLKVFKDVLLPNATSPKTKYQISTNTDSTNTSSTKNEFQWCQLAAWFLADDSQVFARICQVYP